jgi:hypothetical protein
VSRKSRARHKARKARRHAKRAEKQLRREQGLPLFERSGSAEHRDPRERWRTLTARGGLRIGFRGTGITLPIDLDSPDPSQALLEAAADLLTTKPGES